MIDVLAVASEIYPLVKTGGLADVVGALPLAMKSEGFRVTTLVPGYPQVLKAGALTHARQLGDLFGGPASIAALTAHGLDLLVLDAPHLFTRAGGIYGDAGGKDWPDNGERFAALSKAAGLIAGGAIAGYRPALVHSHDWQAGLAPAYVKLLLEQPLPAVMTVHNMAFQGHFPATLFPRLGLPNRAYAIDGVEYYGGVGFLKAGLNYADAITTVSPTYAQEVLTAELGMGLEGLLRLRRSSLTGITNGIDTDVWSPSTDTSLAATYDAQSLQQRADNRNRIDQRFGLAAGPGPLFALVSRLTWQKGIDILIAAAPDDLRQRRPAGGAGIGRQGTRSGTARAERALPRSSRPHHRL